MKVEIEIGEVDQMTATSTKQNLQFLADKLKPRGIAKLMSMFTGLKKIAVETWLKSQGIL